MQRSHRREQEDAETGIVTAHGWVPIRLCAGPQSNEPSGGVGSEGSVQLVLHFVPLQPHPGTPAVETGNDVTLNDSPEGRFRVRAKAEDKSKAKTLDTCSEAASCWCLFPVPTLLRHPVPTLLRTRVVAGRPPPPFLSPQCVNSETFSPTIESMSPETASFGTEG